MANPPPLKTTVREHLDAIGIPYREVGHGALRIDSGSTAVYVNVEQVDGRGVVVLMAPVLADVPEDPERLVQLLVLNTELNFAKFNWRPEEQLIAVDYELLGDFLDREELAVALRAVSRIADEYDERLQEALGGRRPISD